MQSVEFIFLLIFGIIVMVFILTFGGSGIADIFCTGNIGSINKAVKDLGYVVEDVYNFGEGSTQEFQFNAGSAKVCFINPANPSRNVVNGWDPDNIIENITRMKGYNVWIYYNCGGKDTGVRIEKLKTSENFCFSGAKKLFLTNRGRYVDVGL